MRLRGFLFGSVDKNSHEIRQAFLSLYDHVFRHGFIVNGVDDLIDFVKTRFLNCHFLTSLNLVVFRRFSEFLLAGQAFCWFDINKAAHK